MSSPNSKPPVWTCQITAPHEITVGTTFEMSCEGESVSLRKDQVVIYGKELDPDTKQASLNNLKILEIKNISDHSLQATATSYLVGDYEKDGFFVLTDGKTEVALENLKFKVSSVIPANAQDVKPYPANPPWELSFPLWFYILITILIVGPLTGIFLIFKKQKERRALFDSLKQQKTAKPPFDEYHRDIRVLEKKYGVEPQDPKGYVLDLERAFRMYLLRELIVPAQTWSDRAILSEIKSRNKMVWSDNERSLRRVLKEFERARRSQVTSSDCRQLYLMCLEVSEGIFRSSSSPHKKARL